MSAVNDTKILNQYLVLIDGKYKVLLECANGAWYIQQKDIHWIAAVTAKSLITNQSNDR